MSWKKKSVAHFVTHSNCSAIDNGLLDLETLKVKWRRWLLSPSQWEKTRSLCWTWYLHKLYSWYLYLNTMKKTKQGQSTSFLYYLILEDHLNRDVFEETNFLPRLGSEVFILQLKLDHPAIAGWSKLVSLLYRHHRRQQSFEQARTLVQCLADRISGWTERRFLLVWAN